MQISDRVFYNLARRRKNTKRTYTVAKAIFLIDSLEKIVKIWNDDHANKSVEQKQVYRSVVSVVVVLDA